MCNLGLDEAISNIRVSLVLHMVKNQPAMWETWVQSSGKRSGYPLQCSCLEKKSTGRGAWRATVHGSAESDTTEGLTHTYASNININTSANKIDTHFSGVLSEFRDGHPEVPEQCTRAQTAPVVSMPLARAPGSKPAHTLSSEGLQLITQIIKYN